jgi:hypothetical protein
VNPLQARIQEGVSRRSIQQLEADLQAAAASYINVTNSKPLGVYLDVVLPQQYDPLAPLRRSVKVATGDVFDPLKKDLLKAQAERELLQVRGDREAGRFLPPRVAGGGCLLLATPGRCVRIQLLRWWMERRGRMPPQHTILLA